MTASGSRDQQQLQQALQRVHSELAASHRIDSGSRKLLRELLVDIELALGETPGPDRPGGPRASRLEAMAAKLEAQHPGFAGTLRQLLDLLVRAGL
jgi:Domain of unknown function (DUF4404)